MQLRSRFITVVVAGAALLVASAAFAVLLPYFFQGFEGGATSGWFPWGNSSLYSAHEPSASSSYNSGSTSAYANGINAADGAYLARVASAVASGECAIDTSGPGPIDSLVCLGPYTDFGLPSATPDAPLPFPTDGYITQTDVYLDVAYAQDHPDCGSASPIGAPCEPNSPGTVNLACTTAPGVDCEGTRFTWTLGVNRPNGTFLQDYVFQVGTAPALTFGWCPAGGYVINAQYNSYRSGGYPYDLSKDPKCITVSGWYTFKQTFTNDAGFLEVQFDILNPNGTVATCVNSAAQEVGCSWTLHPGHAIDQVGCPAYGWFANEEINDLPFDNTRFSGDCFGESVGMIAETNTLCQAYARDTATTLTQVAYVKKGSTITSVAPGAFFYYTQVSGSAGDIVSIVQDHTGLSSQAHIKILNQQVMLYATNCAKFRWTSLTVNPDGTATGTLPATGTFIVGVKYNPTSLKGTPLPNPPGLTTFSFGTQLNGAVTNIASVELVPK